MSVAEGATAYVLPCEPQLIAFRHQRSQCRELGRSPIEWLFGRCHLTPLLQNSDKPSVRSESFRRRTDCRDNSLQFGSSDRRVDVICISHRATEEVLPGAAAAICQNAKLVLASFLQFLFQNLSPPFHNLVGFFASHTFQRQHAGKVVLEDSLAFSNHLVHRRLRERGLIAFVMSATPKTVHVNDYVALELVAKLHRQLHNLSDRFRVLTIHMEDRNLQHSSHVSGVGAGATFRWRSREANLVVHDDVQRAACPVAG